MTVRCVMTKWGDRPHWQFVGHRLGSDEHGEWLGFPAGTHHARPGLAFDSEVDSVTLIPREGWFLATFHAPGIWCDTYVDIATPAVWEGDVLRAVDLDLDVISMATQLPDAVPREHGPGEVFLDDEDEFAEHRVAYGYPDEVVATAERTASDLLRAMRAGEPPYDGGTAATWLARLGSI